MSIATPISPPIVTARIIAEQQRDEWQTGHATGCAFCQHATLEVVPVVGDRAAFIVAGLPDDVADLSDVARASIRREGLLVVDYHCTEDGAACVFIVAEIGGAL